MFPPLTNTHLPHNDQLPFTRSLKEILLSSFCLKFLQFKGFPAHSTYAFTVKLVCSLDASRSNNFLWLWLLIIIGQNVIDMEFKIMSVQYNNYLENAIWLASRKQILRNTCLPDMMRKKWTRYSLTFCSFPNFMCLKFIFLRFSDANRVE